MFGTITLNFRLYIEGAFVAESEFYPKARMKVGSEASVNAVHRQAIA
jgi:hypothetical protein